MIFGFRMSNNVRKCKFYLRTADRTNSPLIPKIPPDLIFFKAQFQIDSNRAVNNWSIFSSNVMDTESIRRLRGVPTSKFILPGSINSC